MTPRTVLLTLGTVLLPGLGPTDFDPLGLLLDFFGPPFKADGGDSNSELSSSYVRGRLILRWDVLVGPSPTENDGEDLFFELCWCDLPELPPFVV